MLTREMIEAAGLDYDKVLKWMHTNKQAVRALTSKERTYPRPLAPTAGKVIRPRSHTPPPGTIERRPWETIAETPAAKIERLGSSKRGRRVPKVKDSPCHIVHELVTTGYTPSQAKASGWNESSHAVACTTLGLIETSVLALLEAV